MMNYSNAVTNLMGEFTRAQEKYLKSIDILLNLGEVEVAPTPKELIYQEDRMQLYHYKSQAKNVCPVPILIVYALVNRQYMMDLQEDRSLVKNLLSRGLDIYMIDWGYPGPESLCITLEDYIDGYINTAVDIIRKRHKLDSINLGGVCQGGTFSTIYTALYPEKVKNLVVMVAPIDFHTNDGLLNIWARHLDVDAIVDSFDGVVPGSFMNVGFIMLKPFQLMIDKYVGLMENFFKKDVVENFMRMEKWIFDSPGQAGEAFRRFIKECYQQNLLIKNKLKIGGRTVDLRNIECPVMNIYAEEDHLVPPACSIPLNDAILSKDKTLMPLKGGHIGIYVSSQSQNELAPAIADWVISRSQVEKKKASAKAESN